MAPSGPDFLSCGRSCNVPLAEHGPTRAEVLHAHAGMTRCDLDRVLASLPGTNDQTMKNVPQRRSFWLPRPVGLVPRLARIFLRRILDRHPGIVDARLRPRVVLDVLNIDGGHDHRGLWSFAHGDS